MKTKYVVGIDEVGRGPIAGPVAVGAFLIKTSDLSKIRRLFYGVKESKQLTASKREFWKAKIDQVVELGICKYKVTMVSSSVIDQKGISFAIKKALLSSLSYVTSSLLEHEVKVLLDGGLKAPEEFINQKTIIKGDEKEILIALASIVAKVVRDGYMTKISKRYPGYSLDVHKGYGTQAHMIAVKKLGMTPEHRTTFIKII